MLKKVIIAATLFWGTAASVLWAARAYSYQIELVGPKDITIPSGWSSWTTELPAPIKVNPLRVVFWNTGECKYIPVTNISVKYKGIPYWSSTEWKDCCYYGDREEEIVAVRVDFYQNQVEKEVCMVKVSGYIP